MRVQLTDRFCERAKAEAGAAQTDYFDAGMSGLALRVGRGKSWTLHYSQGGKRKRLTLGAYPATSLAAARRKALEAKAQIEEGHAPGAKGADTLRAICEEWLGRAAPKRSKDWYEKTLARLVFPALGARPIGDIRRSEIVRLLDRIEDENGPVMADMTLSFVRTAMNWHASRSDEFRSPIVRGMARTKPKERARKRILSDEELRKVWSAEAALAPLVRFILLTSARRTEALGLTQEEIDGRDWTLPAARNKTKVDLVRPLSEAAMEVLASREGNLSKRRRVGPVVQGAPREPRPFIFKQGMLSAQKRDFDKACGVSGWTLHDLRRTARSLMSRAGVPSDHAERCLGHVIPGIRGVYDRHEFKEEKARAFEALAGQIDRIVNPRENVVPLRGAER
jgi:integrase